MIRSFRHAVRPFACVLAVLGITITPAGAQTSGYVATHGAAPFTTQHLLPGSTLALDHVDRASPMAQVVALTIDDGPDDRDLSILDILRDHDAKATFFYIGGKIARHHDVAARVVASGNEVGSHSQTHPMMTALLPAERERNLGLSEAALAGIDVHPLWFRPPYGAVDGALAALTRVHGMQTVLWTIDSQDWKGGSSDTIARRIIDRLSPGAVILVHSTKAATLKALPAVLEAGARQGLRFVTMTEWERAMRQAEAQPLALLHSVPGR